MASFLLVKRMGTVFLRRLQFCSAVILSTNIALIGWQCVLLYFKEISITNVFAVFCGMDCRYTLFNLMSSRGNEIDYLRFGGKTTFRIWDQWSDNFRNAILGILIYCCTVFFVLVLFMIWYRPHEFLSMKGVRVEQVWCQGQWLQSGSPATHSQSWNFSLWAPNQSPGQQRDSFCSVEHRRPLQTLELMYRSASAWWQCEPPQVVRSARRHHYVCHLVFGVRFSRIIYNFTTFVLTFSIKNMIFNLIDFLILRRTRVGFFFFFDNLILHLQQWK